MDRALLCVVAVGLVACGGSGSPPNGKLSVDIAALSLEGVADAVWDIRVDNGATTPQEVFSARVTASRFGAGASANYIGTCDAQAGGTLVGGRWSAPNTVHVRLRGIYDAPLGGNVGQPGSAAPAGSLAFQDPGDLAQTITCSASDDTRVTFDVTVLRPAEQGFFDVAVQFQDVFCSAKYDCGAAATLFDATNTRKKTHILGVACTAGPDPDVDSAIWFNDVRLTCGSSTSVIDLGSGVGNLCTPGAADGSSAPTNCATPTLLPAAGPLFQAAVYRGVEQLPGLSKVYVDVALGLENTVGSCHLTFDATADDLAHPALIDGAIGASQIYPYIVVDVPDLATCTGNHAVNADAIVSTRYSFGSPKEFDNAWSAAGLQAAPPDPLVIDPDAVVMQAGTTQLFSVEGGTAPFVFSVVSGGGSFVDATYTASAVPGSALVRVTDGAGVTADATVTITPAPLVIAPTPVTVQAGTTQVFGASGGTPPYTFTLSSGGGAIVGTTYTAPSTPGSAVVRVTDAANVTKDAAVTITPAPLVIAPAPVTMQAGATQVFSASGGTPPYTFSVASGAGSIVGATYTAPAAPGSAVVRVTDAASATSDASVTITPAPLQIVPSSVSIPLGSTYPFSATGGTPPLVYEVVSGGGSFSGATYSAPLAAGSVVVRVRDALGDASSANVTIQNGWLLRDDIGGAAVSTGVGWRDVASDGTSLVAVSTSWGALARSTDGGASWTFGAPAMRALYAVAHNGSMWVAVGAKGHIQTSSDGITWTTRTSPVTAWSFYSVAYGGGRWVIVGERMSILTSTDGINWTNISIGSNTNTLNEVGFNGTGWVGVGSGGTIVNSASGTSFTVGYSGNDYALNGLAWNGTVWVAAGATGLIMTSPNGTTWTQRTTGTLDAFYGVAASGARVVVVGYNGATWTSADGTSFTSQRAATSHTLQDVAAHGAGWVAVGDNGELVLGNANAASWARVDDTRFIHNSALWDVEYANNTAVIATNNGVMYSSDGLLTWDFTPLANSVYGVAYSGGTWITVGVSGAIYTSTDLITWTKRTCGSITAALYAVECGGGVCVAGGDTGNSICISSNNGTSWSTSSTSSPSAFWRSAAYGNGTFVFGSTTEVRYWDIASGIGAGWTAANISNCTGGPGAITHNGSQFAAVCGNGMSATSSNGRGTWSQSGALPGSMIGRGIVWNPVASEYLAVSGARGVVAASSNGLTWTLRAILGRDLEGLAWDGSRYIAVSQIGGLVTSPTGASWTTQHGLRQNNVTGIAYLASVARWVAIDSNGLIHHSPDRATWTTLNRGFDTLKSVACNATRCVLAGDGGALWSSDDAINWTARNLDSSITTSLDAIAWNGSTFVAVGAFGKIVSSSDGINWTLATSNTTASLYGVAFGGSQWVAVGTSGTVITSSNGSSWSTQTTIGGSVILVGVAHSGSQWVAVALNGQAYRSSNAASGSWSSAGVTSEALTRVTWDGDRWVSGGSAGSLWTSTNGASWSQLTDPALAFQSLSALTRVGTILAAGGNRVSGFVATLAR